LPRRICNSLGNFSEQEVHVVETTLKKGTRVTGVDRSKLATLLGSRYDSGESIRSIAASTGRSYGFVHRILTETGVTLRGRGGATRSRKTKVKR
jgi:Helix-turn-helix domain